MSATQRQTREFACPRCAERGRADFEKPVDAVARGRKEEKTLVGLADGFEQVVSTDWVGGAIRCKACRVGVVWL